MNHRHVIVALIACAGCGEDANRTEPRDEICGAGTRAGDGGCIDAGVQANGCPAGEIGVDGVCVPAGVPADACAEGFVAEAGGCSAVLATMPCESGTMAVPGDTTCKPVGDCGSGTWGNIVTEANTQHVDAAYAGGASDGSAAQPWVTIQEGVDAAAPGAIVGVAAGSYSEDVLVTKPLRLMGRCAGLVEIAAPSTSPPVLIGDAGEGAALSGVAVRGGGFAGVAVSGAIGVELSDLWVHDTPSFGILVTNEIGPASATVRGVLVERAVKAGIAAAGAELSIVSSLVRDVALGTATLGSGIAGQPDPVSGLPSTVSVSATVAERNEGAGVYLLGSVMSIDASVLRDNVGVSTGDFGAGIYAFDAANSVGELTLSKSVIERNASVGVGVAGVPTSLDAMTIRDTGFDAAGLLGFGVATLTQPATQSSTHTALSRSLLERDAGGGAVFSGTSGLLEGVLVRGSATQGADVAPGIASQTLPGEVFASVRAIGSRIETARGIGAFVYAAELALEGVAIAGTVATSAAAGMGLQAEPDFQNGTLPIVTLDACALTDQRAFGVAVLAGALSLDATLVRSTTAGAQTEFGDGIGTAAYLPTHTTIRSSQIESNQRAGLSIFGAAVDVATTAFVCNSFDIDVEVFAGNTGSVVDQGGNTCGCNEPATCKAVSAQITPPSPVGM